MFSSFKNYLFPIDYEEIIQNKIKESNILLLQKKFTEASEKLHEAILVYKKTNDYLNNYEYIQTLYKYKNCVKEFDIHSTIKICNRLLTIHDQKGDFNKSCKICEEIAELCEKIESFPDAINYYHTAIDRYKLNSSSLIGISNLQEKIANLISFQQSVLNYKDAYLLFEKLGKNSKFSKKTFYTKAILCILSYNDIVLAKIKLVEYSEDYVDFLSSIEYNFINGIIVSIENNNVEKFEDSCFTYDKITILDKWKINILTHIKQLNFEECEENEEIDLS